jgi:hypothetical protein
MAKSAECESPTSKTKTGPTGPRTTEGKSNSRWNSLKHLIFLSGILPEEEEVASTLFRGFKKDLQLTGTLELEINSDLVYSRLVERRLRRYEANALDKAQIYSLLSNWDQLDSRNTSGLYQSTNSNEAAPEKGRVRLPLWFCVLVLVLLERDVKMRGPSPENDVKVLEHLFRNRMSKSIAEVICIYKLLDIILEQHEEDKKMVETFRTKFRLRILKGLDLVIAELAHRSAFEQLRDDIEDEGKFEVLPPDAILDRSERYRSVNDRRFSRHLQNLENIRHLRARNNP